MRIRFELLTIGCLLVVSGCQTAKGPRFDPYLTMDDALSSDSTNALFMQMVTTNRVPAEWNLPPTDFFKLGPGDLIEVEILGEPGSVSNLLIGPDGKIYYSLLPGIMVWGMTLGEAKSTLEEALAQYIRIKPEVALTLRGVASRRFWILGNVPTPGVYTLATPMTILEGVALAGGAITVPGLSQTQADLPNSFIMRDGQLLPVDLDRLFRGGDLTQNIYLQPGDYIYIRPAVPRDIYVLGAVALPNIVPFKEQASLVGAIASAGGTIEYAHLSHVAIIRGSLSNPTIAIVDYKKMVKGQIPNVALEQGDIVYVPFTPFQKILQFADGILSEFVRTVALNEGRNAVLEDAEPVSVSVGVGGSGTSVGSP